MKRATPPGTKKKRNLSDYLRIMVHQKSSPEAIGRGVCAGLLVAFSPFYGLHTVLSLLLALLVRGSKIAAVLFVMVTNPLTALPIYTFTYWLGTTLFAIPRQQGILHGFLEQCVNGMHWWSLEQTRIILYQAIQLGRDAFVPLLAGGLVAAATAMLIGYPATVFLINQYRTKRSNNLSSLKRQRNPHGSE